MRKLLIIGIGAGNPEQVTVQAIKAMNMVDVFFFMDKGDDKSDLVRLRKEICERYVDRKSYRIIEVADPERDPAISSYVDQVELWHLQRTIIYEELVATELGEDDCGAFLVWGDPSLYDSTLRIVDHLIGRGNVQFDYEIIPGITSVQTLAARHRIALNEIGKSIRITTGRQLLNSQAGEMENTVVMLDGNCSFKNMLDDDLEIYWGAYLGTDKEILLSGNLHEIAANIEATRSEARRKNGWIMDTYLLKKSNF